ncbi:MAG: glycosyltransferase family 2 protein [Clostridium sp.]|uniref:glycosyltransferase family 2 protein n=1 Tax=Clostridium sp. TaxID=1506 RepID=UPI003EE5A389
MNSIKVSIIIPIYNTEKYLRETINSILNNSFQEFEIICIDDGSIDRSLEILSEFKKIDNRIRVYTKENNGPSKTRNLGLDKAIGKYIVFMDSDDILPKDSLISRYEAIEKSNSDIVIGGTNRFNEEKEWRMEKHYLEEGEKDISKDFKLLRNLGPCNKIYKSSILSEIRFNENLNYAEDVSFVLEALVKSKKIYTIDKLVYKYRDRNDSLTSYRGREEEVLENSIESLIETFKMLDRIGIDKNKESLKKYYLERVIDVDIWPVYRSNISSKKRYKMSLSILNMLKRLDENIIKDSKKVEIFIAKSLYENSNLYIRSEERFKSEIKNKIKEIYWNKNNTFEKTIFKFLKQEKKRLLCIYLLKEKFKRILEI